MANVALMTIGLLRAPYDDPQTQGFMDRAEANFTAAKASPGFIDLSEHDEETDTHTWHGRSYPPIFQDEAFTDLVPQTLSLWQDLESVFAFAYHGIHAEALSKRQEWFVPPKWPTYVAWWVADEHTPSWVEAYGRYDRLCRGDSSPDAFNFKSPFDSDGQPTKIDRDIVKRNVSQNQ